MAQIPDHRRAGGHKPHIRLGGFDRSAYKRTRSLLEENRICTVCMEANCPNRYECFASKTATFMILGDCCTRNCRYCNVTSRKPLPVDPDEPRRIAQAVKSLDLSHAVITCVTRDDLADGGADHFVSVIQAIRSTRPACGIEVLISDLQGNQEALAHILNAQPNILNHNIEVVERLFPGLRPQGSYQRSLQLMERAHALAPDIPVKSGLMVGLGETDDEVVQTLQDLRKNHCSLLTVGQYLRPTDQHAPIERMLDQDWFDTLRRTALELGFDQVAAGPLVRSSYHAREMANPALD